MAEATSSDDSPTPQASRRIGVETAESSRRVRVETAESSRRIRVETPESSRRIRVGVGGWTFEPWRDNFFPKDLPHARELGYASRQLSAIEVNGTYYSTQKPATFARWRDETPDDFVFSLKALRYTTNCRVLAEAGDSVKRFLGSGLEELGPKLGPIVWQFAPTKRFDAADFEAFVALLPPAIGSCPLRHVMDVRHASFRCAEYVDLARRHGVATVFTDSADFPSFADTTADFAYARLMCADAAIADGYSDDALDVIASTAREWAAGIEPGNLPRVEETPPPAPGPRDVFLYFINGAKERAPAAAMALLRRLSDDR